MDNLLGTLKGDYLFIKLVNSIPEICIIQLIIKERWTATVYGHINQ